MHLFDVDLPTGESWRESASYDAGSKAVVVERTPVGRLGLAICYDLRFPALFERLSEAGAQMISVPAAFTVPTGKAHWEVLLRARAIEAGLFVVAAAQSGEHEDGRRTYGHSLVVDPWGEVLLNMEERIGVGFAEVDLSRIEDVRQRLPAMSHRRRIPEAVGR
jgi:predicted amidohydrolase